MAVKTRCPHCKKVFSLKSDASVGKKCRCTNCEEQFVVKKFKAPEAAKEKEAPEEEYDYSYDDEDYEVPEEEEVEEYDEPPKRKSSGGGRSRSKKTPKKKGGANWLMPVIIISIALPAVGLLGWGGYLLVTKVFMGNVVNMAHFPEETELLVYIRPREIWNAPLLNDLKNLPTVAEQIKKAQTGVDVQPSDIDSITIGVTHITEAGRSRLTFGLSGAGSTQKTMIVMRFTRDIPPSEIEKQPGISKSQYNNHSIYRSRTSYWQPDPRTLVIADDAVLRAAIDRGSQVFRFKHLDLGNSKQHLMMVSGPRGETAPNKTADPTTLDGAMNRYTKGVYFGLKVDTGLTAEFKSACFSSDDATKLKEVFEKEIASNKTKIGTINPIIANQIQPLLAVGREALDSLKVSTAGSTVTINGQVSNKLADAIKQMSQNPLFSSGAGQPIPPGQMQMTPGGN